MEWIGLILRGLFYAICIAILAPALWFFRIDPRIDYAEDLAFGYDDDDPGEDIDE